MVFSKALMHATPMEMRVPWTVPLVVSAAIFFWVERCILAGLDLQWAGRDALASCMGIRSVRAMSSPCTGCPWPARGFAGLARWIRRFPLTKLTGKPDVPAVLAGNGSPAE